MIYLCEAVAQGVQSFGSTLCTQTVIKIVLCKIIGRAYRCTFEARIECYKNWTTILFVRTFLSQVWEMIVKESSIKEID